MFSKLSVKKAADPNFIPVEYEVISMKPGSSKSATYCVIQVVRVGWDTESNYNNWIPRKVYAPAAPINPLTPIQPVQGEYICLSGRNTAGMQGTLGNLEVANLANLVSYSTVIITYTPSGGIVMGGAAITSSP